LKLQSSWASVEIDTPLSLQHLMTAFDPRFRLSFSQRFGLPGTSTAQNSRTGVNRDVHQP
jgi:hypothetical protein